MVHWDDIVGRPGTFPPEHHTHTQADVNGLTQALAAAEARTAALEEALEALAPAGIVWTPLSLNAGFVARNASYAPQVGISGDTVFVRGQLDRSKSSAAASGGVVLTLPPDLAPGYEVQIPVKVGGAAVNSWFRPNGELYMSGSSEARYQVLDVVFGRVPK
ncbi:MAG: hypothetical protein ACTMIK_09145 [Galactobacter sp.]